VPAAAVIPAPIAYANTVAVKKLVVGFKVGGCTQPTHLPDWLPGDLSRRGSVGVVEAVGSNPSFSSPPRPPCGRPPPGAPPRCAWVGFNCVLTASAFQARNKCPCRSLLKWWWKRTSYGTNTPIRGVLGRHCEQISVFKAASVIG